jgi:hypothetical protein
VNRIKNAVRKNEMNFGGCFFFSLQKMRNYFNIFLVLKLSNSEVETERLTNLVGSLEARVRTLEEGSLLDAKAI